MPKKPANPDDKNIMDVSRPGKSEPNASGRPIIISRRPIVQDPMVREANEKSTIPGPPTVDSKELRLKSLSRNKGSISINSEGEIKNEDTSVQDAILPPNDTPVEEKPAEAPVVAPLEPQLPAVKEIIEPDHIKTHDDKPEVDEPKKSEEPTEKEIKPTSNQEKKIEPDAADEQVEKDKADDIPEEQKSQEDDDAEKEVKQAEGQDGIVDELAKQAMSKKQKQQDEKDKETKANQVNKLIAEKKYFLPIGQVTRRRKSRKMLLVLLLLIVLGVVGANFAIDAGLVQTNIKPLTNVFPD